MVIHIIASALPPKLDGIGDYTALLSVELAKSERIKVLTDREQTPYPITGVEVTPAFTKNDPKSYWDLLPIIEADKPDWVLLQYNPFSYGHRGLNLQLPEVMRQIKKRCPGTKVAVMVHEMFVPLTNWKFLAMSPWQRWQFWRLAGDADVMFFSVGIWADKVRPLRRGRPTLHLPVGSNIPHVSITRTEARARLGITDNTLVLGLFGNAHIEKKLDVVRDAAHALSEAGHNITVLHLGSDKVTVGELLKNIPMIADGALPAEEVSCRFAAMDIHLLPFSDGISTRRTTLMTGLQHGIATVGTKGYRTDIMLQKEGGHAFLLAKATDRQQFINHVSALAADTELRHEIGISGQKLYEQYFDAPIISAQVLAHLHTNV